MPDGYIESQLCYVIMEKTLREEGGVRFCRDERKARGGRREAGGGVKGCGW